MPEIKTTNLKSNGWNVRSNGWNVRSTNKQTNKQTKGSRKMTYTKAILNRAARTVAQTAVALIGTSNLIDSVSWSTVLSGSILAGLLSVLTSISTTLPEVKAKS